MSSRNGEGSDSSKSSSFVDGISEKMAGKIGGKVGSDLLSSLVPGPAKAVAKVFGSVFGDNIGSSAYAHRKEIAAAVMAFSDRKAREAFEGSITPARSAGLTENVARKVKEAADQKVRETKKELDSAQARFEFDIHNPDAKARDQMEVSSKALEQAKRVARLAGQTAQQAQSGTLDPSGAMALMAAVSGGGTQHSGQDKVDPSGALALMEAVDNLKQHGVDKGALEDFATAMKNMKGREVVDPTGALAMLGEISKGTPVKEGFMSDVIAKSRKDKKSTVGGWLNEVVTKGTIGGHAVKGGFMSEVETGGSQRDGGHNGGFMNEVDTGGHQGSGGHHEGGYHSGFGAAADTGGVAPIALDLNQDSMVSLRSLTSSENSPRFDWSGDGAPQRTAWVGPEDGLLVIDLGTEGQAGPDGQINQAKELAFTEWVQGSADASEHTDMTALREVFDTNGNAQLDAGDERWNEFRVWQDASQDGQTNKGELRTLEQAGIERIALTPSPDGARTLIDGTTVTGTSSYTQSDGSQGVAEDTVLRYAKNSRDGAATPSMQQLREELARSKVLQSEEALYGDAMPQYRVDERRTQPSWTPSAEDIAWSEEQGAKMMEKLGMTPMQSTPVSRWHRAKAWLGGRLGGAQSMTDVMDAPSKVLPGTSELAGNAKLASSGPRFDMNTKAATGIPPVTSQPFMS